jgi:hypothetical protein
MSEYTGFGLSGYDEDSIQTSEAFDESYVHPLLTEPKETNFIDEPYIHPLETELKKTNSFLMLMKHEDDEHQLTEEEIITHQDSILTEIKKDLHFSLGKLDKLTDALGETHLLSQGFSDLSFLLIAPNDNIKIDEEIKTIMFEQSRRDEDEAEKKIASITARIANKRQKRLASIESFDD